MSKDYYIVLAGGVGGAKFVNGLMKVVSPDQLKVIVNTADDISLFGLEICPDLDIITYTMANCIDEEKGWGFVDESFNCLSILKKYYGFDWFNAGDKDLATHIYRTNLFKMGFTKAESTKKICEKLGIQSEIFPMCNEKVATIVNTDIGKIHFEEYYIRHKCEPKIIGFEFQGFNEAQPVKEVLSKVSNAKKIIIAPSNPIVSIGTILRVKGFTTALKENRDKVIAISPIIQGAAVKGPADKMLAHFGYEVSCIGVAKYYKELISHIIIDIRDSSLQSQIEQLGINVHCFDTLMINLDKKINLARAVVELD